MGIMANPNVLGARSGTKHLVQLVSLQKPLSDDGAEVYGSDDEPDGKLIAFTSMVINGLGFRVLVDCKVS